MNDGVIDAAALTPPGPPHVSRPVMPQGYGVPGDGSGHLTWAQVLERLTSSLHYWLATTRPDGRPHLVPRWGVWMDGRFWYDGAPTTRHARNLAENPYVAMSLENGREAVIVEGRSRPVRANEAVGARIADAFSKYHQLGYHPNADSWSAPDGGGLRVISPDRAMAWFDFPADCTRFRW